MKPLLLSFLSTLSVVLGVVGLGVLGVGLARMGRASRSRSWPTARGTLVSSTVTQRTAPAPRRVGEDEEEADRRPPVTLYRPEVKYTYSVDGRTFTGTRLSLEELEVGSEKHARQHAARYARGAPVTVFYDPEDPDRAVLEPGVGTASWALPAVGLAFLIVPGAFYLFIRWWYAQ